MRKLIATIFLLTTVSAFAQSDNIQIVRIRRDIALLQAEIDKLGTNTYYVTNIYNTNLVVTNIYSTNFTTIITNTYVTNFTYEVTNTYTTNITEYFTNNFTTNITYLVTNIYNTNFTYYVTNVFDTYITNSFTTNITKYFTNSFTTNITFYVTNSFTTNITYLVTNTYSFTNYFSVTNALGYTPATNSTAGITNLLLGNNITNGQVIVWNGTVFVARSNLTLQSLSLTPFPDLSSTLATPLLVNNGGAVYQESNVTVKNRDTNSPALTIAPSLGGKTFNAIFTEWDGTNNQYLAWNGGTNLGRWTNLPAGGGGDVSLAANQVFTGSNTFTQPLNAEIGRKYASSVTNGVTSWTFGNSEDGNTYYLTNTLGRRATLFFCGYGSGGCNNTPGMTVAGMSFQGGNTWIITFDDCHLGFMCAFAYPMSPEEVVTIVPSTGEDAAAVYLFLK